MNNDNDFKDRYLLLDTKELTILATSDLNNIDEGGSIACVNKEDFKSSVRDAVKMYLGEKNDLSTTIEILIRNWVEENFGESEAEDPSWNIEALAEHLAINL